MQEQYYVRFGEIPPGGISMNWASMRYEPGLCVFPAVAEVDGSGEVIDWGIKFPMGNSKFIRYLRYDWRDLYSHFRNQGRKAYLVKGKFVGRGRDWEPCIKETTVVCKLQYKRMIWPY
jgi:hypothetical protein